LVLEKCERQKLGVEEVEENGKIVMLDDTLIIHLLRMWS
jgi:hypothetical protein